MDPDDVVPAVEITPEADTLRGAIEQAFEQSEKEAAPTTTSTPETPGETTPTPTPAPAEEPAPAEAAPPTETPAPGETFTSAVPDEFSTAPKSWKSAAKSGWSKLDLETRKEIVRRERDIERVIGESGQARNLASQFAQAVRPYEARIRAMNINPVQAVQRLFQADYVLSSAPAVQRAKFMADLIKQYGVDIKELDNALAGEGPADPVQAQVDQLLQQRLAPLNQFLQSQQAQQQTAMQQRAAQAQTEVEAMATDPKYPHFEAVRKDMADLVDFYSARGVYKTLDEVYSKAVAMNPELGAQAAKEAVRQQAAIVNQQTQRALAASASINGSPGGTPAKGAGEGSLRSAVEAAWAAHAGR